MGADAVQHGRFDGQQIGSDLASVVDEREELELLGLERQDDGEPFAAFRDEACSPSFEIFTGRRSSSAQER